jgi:dynein heavy chain 1
VNNKDFITMIISFDSDTITPKMRTTFQNDYVADPNFTVEAANRGCKAAGPLVKWMLAQLEKSEILHKIAPLRARVKALEEGSVSLVKEKEEIDATVKEQEKAISRSKDEYAVLIGETESIRAQKEATSAKVTRSTQLLASLNFERARWEEESKSFVLARTTVIGDVLLCAGFIAYLGFFDQQIRHMLLTDWKDHIVKAQLPTKPDLAIVEYLSRPDDRVGWVGCGLPEDDLSTENAIMLTRFNRYPLIIDPSGQATDFVLNLYNKKASMTKTSFLDASFMKSMETALRFGSTILVEDVENIDPILNSVLNKEVVRQGGRILMRLGDQEIDFSPSFAVFMTTRDPKCRFAPDLCSRVTFVNFTITASGLQSQCLNHVLKSERPDIDKKRSDLLKLQGEFTVTLRNLEKKLLNALAESSGNILENDSLIATLEVLKKDSSEVKAKMLQSDEVMKEVQGISQFYQRLASQCAQLYFVLLAMADVSFLYQFSVQFFLDVYKAALSDQSILAGLKDPKDRLDRITAQLYQLLYLKVARSMRSEDCLAFAVRLVQVRLEGKDADLDNLEIDLLLKTGGIAGMQHSTEKPPAGLLTTTQENRLRELTTVICFKKIFSHMNEHKDQWEKFLTSSVGAGGKLPFPQGVWESKDGVAGEATQLLRELILLKSCRPDRVVAGAKRLVKAVLGEHFMELPVPDLRSIILDETDAHTPIIMCAVPGYDPSGQVQDLVTKLNKTCRQLALGSPEGYDLAEKAINSGAKEGWWVVLKNIHLAPHWVETMEKKLHHLTPHRDFRVIMTMEINPCISTNLLRMSTRLIYEAPSGMKASLKRTVAMMPDERMNKAPAERSRIYVLIAWLHGVIQERLRYTPLGWSKKYEFNESDLKCSLDAIDEWVELVAQGKSNVAPDKIPWVALRKLVGGIFYGGRIDNEFDSQLMDGFLEATFSADAFGEFPLVKDETESIMMPENTTRAKVQEWIQQLPENDSPIWLGLPGSAETMLREVEGTTMLRNLLSIQNVTYDDEAESKVVGQSRPNEKANEGIPKWITELKDVIAGFLKQLPESCPVTQEDGSHLGPVQRCLKREALKISRLLKQIRKELDECFQVALGKERPTVQNRELMRLLAADTIPPTWRKYPVHLNSCRLWIKDLTRRVKQLIDFHDQPLNKLLANVWIGGLCDPPAYFTATRQATAQANKWALEQLDLVVLLKNEEKKGLEFEVTGMSIDGAKLESGVLAATSQISSELPLMRFKWVLKTEIKKDAGQANIPVYLNSTRAQLLAHVTIPTPPGKPSRLWYQRGVALGLWSNSAL